MNHLQYGLWGDRRTFITSRFQWQEWVLMRFSDVYSLFWPQAFSKSELQQHIYGVSLRFTYKTAGYEFYILMFASLPSSHPEVVKTTVHPSTGPQLPHTGAAAHWVAGKRTLWVFCGCFSQKETQQKLVLPRGHLPVPQGKSMTIITETIL